MRLVVAGIKTQGGAKMGFALGKMSLQGEGMPKVAFGLRIVRIQFYRGPEMLDGATNVLLLGKNTTQVVMSGPRTRIFSQRGAPQAFLAGKNACPLPAQRHQGAKHSHCDKS